MAASTTAKLDVLSVAKHTLQSIDRERESEIIARRFGLDGKKETLEQVGETLNITRERVRQIEKATLIRLKLSLDNNNNPEFSAAEKEIIKTLHEMGRASQTETLAAKLTGKNSSKNRAAITLLAELSPKMIVIGENDQYYASIALFDGHDDKQIKSAADDIAKIIKKHGEPIALEQLHDLTTGYEHPDEVAAIASLSKKISTLAGVWGLSTWPTVNPRNIRDKIFVVMTQNGKPMHFNDIAKTIKSQNFVRNNITQQAIHNELIKDKRFVLVGRGIYALDTWGFKQGSITDIITGVLKVEQPLHREEIVRRVLKERQVREATVLLNLQNKPNFKRVAKAQYALDEEYLAGLEKA